jgi:DNA-binding SARP family transcriptional activator
MLGPFTVALDGTQVPRWSGMLGRSLLAHLIWSHPQPMTRDLLLAAFWPEVPDRSARNRLHVVLHDIRRDLASCGEVPVVLYHNGSYVLAPELEVVTDVRRATALMLAASAAAKTAPEVAIAHLEEAVALYRGAFCEDCPHDEWAHGERDYQRGRKLDAMSKLAELHLDGGDLASSVDVCRRLLMEDRCHEQAHQTLMRAHSRLGQHHLALRQFERCRRDLRAELNLEPDPMTLALAEAIRRRQPV